MSDFNFAAAGFALGALIAVTLYICAAIKLAFLAGDWALRSRHLSGFDFGVYMVVIMVLVVGPFVAALVGFSAQ